MNRLFSFSISLIAHVSCVWLMLLTGKAGKEEPIVVETCRVTLFSPGQVGPSGPPSGPVAKSPSLRPIVKKEAPAPKPVFVTRNLTRPKPRPQPEPSPELPRLTKLEQEKSPVLPRKATQEDAEGMGEALSRGVAVSAGRAGSGGAAFSYDAYISRGVAVSAGPAGSGGAASSYDAYIAAVIKSNWVTPSRAVVGQDPPSVSVAIRISIDGGITLTKVTRSSGIALLDVSALKAIERSDPLPIGLPSYVGSRYYDVTIVFRITDEV